jgi:hypothetical protein
LLSAVEKGGFCDAGWNIICVLGAPRV